MTFPKISRYQAFTWGAAGLAGTGAFLGLKHGSSDEDPMTRMSAGMSYTAAAAVPLGIAGVAAYTYGPKRLASHLGSAVKWHAGKMKAAYGKDASSRFRTELTALRKKGPVTAEMMSSARTASQLKALPGLLSKGPIMMGAGALIGAAVAGEDNRTAGALIGTGVGAAASIAIGAGGMWKKMGKSPIGKAGKAGMFLALAGAAFGAGQGSYLDSKVAASAVPDPDSGETEYADPSVAEQYRSGAGRRSRRMRASGDVVLGMHAGRHG